MCGRHYQAEWASRPHGACSVAGCERNAYSGGLCAMHYKRLRAQGDAGEAAARFLHGSIEERFDALVNKQGAVPDHAPHLGPCWEFTRKPNSDGYAKLTVGDRGIPLHRWAYEYFVGPIPEGLQLDHLCRVRHCVNPEHLEPVTNQVNGLRGEGFAAKQARQTHCKRGHLLEGDNLKPDKLGRRICKACVHLHRHDRYVRLGK